MPASDKLLWDYKDWLTRVEAHLYWRSDLEDAELLDLPHAEVQRWLTEGYRLIREGEALALRASKETEHDVKIDEAGSITLGADDIDWFIRGNLRVLRENQSEVERLALGTLDAYRSIGDMVRSLREDQGLTREQLADRARTTTGILSHLETNRRTTTLDILTRLASALGHRLEVHWRPMNEPQGTPEAVNLKGLTPDSARLVADLVEVLPLLPPALHHDLRDRVTTWKTRYVGGKPTE